MEELHITQNEKEVCNTINETSRKRHHSWFFTLNNYKESDTVTLPEILKSENCKFVFQEEKGKSGTPHLQGTINFANAKTFSAVSKLFGKRAHLEVAKNWLKCIHYCTKLDTRNGEIFSNFDYANVKTVSKETAYEDIYNTVLDNWAKNPYFPDRFNSLGK